jgi:hypothetical protein
MDVIAIGLLILFGPSIICVIIGVLIWACEQSSSGSSYSNTTN